MTDGPSDKSRSVALLLSIFLGFVGAHRFYTGKTGTAVLMALTAGGLGLWWMYDIILLAGGGFRDAGGRLVLNWDAESLDSGASAAIPQAVLDELELLRHEVAELAERVDFTERLLARPPEDRTPSPPTFR
ncbi:MAG TPA: TM2 domain-containing protein [Gemmatimonadales bacterium]|nr:TM2 domain-containing protein [Gemmatimonadales bacterium]